MKLRTIYVGCLANMPLNKHDFILPNNDFTNLVYELWGQPSYFHQYSKGNKIHKCLFNISSRCSFPEKQQQQKKKKKRKKKKTHMKLSLKLHLSSPI